MEELLRVVMGNFRLLLGYHQLLHMWIKVKCRKLIAQCSAKQMGPWLQVHTNIMYISKSEEGATVTRKLKEVIQLLCKLSRQLMCSTQASASKLVRGCMCVGEQELCVFICFCICTSAFFCAKPCAIGCLQVVYAERNNSKSLVKGANSPFKSCYSNTNGNSVRQSEWEDRGREMGWGEKKEAWKRKEENNVRPNWRWKMGEWQKMEAWKW